MRFKGTPNLRVIDTKKKVRIGVFDSKGYLEIEDEALFDRMKRRFKEAPVRRKKAAATKVKEVK